MNHYREIAGRLQEFNLDAMLITGGHNLYYASGFNSGNDGVTLVTVDGAWYFTDFRYIEAATELVKGAAIDMVDAKRDYSFFLNKVIEEQGLKRVGFEEAAMTVDEYQRFCGSLRCELVPAQKLFLPLRQIKREEEIEYIVRAQRIAERALEEALGYMKPGMTEKEIAARLTYDMMRFGGEKNSFDPIVASGPNSSMPHAVPTDRKIQPGEFVTMDFGCICGGYCSDMTRTVVVGGKPSAEMEKIYSVVLEAQIAGIAAAKAGVSGKEVDGAARSVIEKAGYGAYFGHSFGHGIGLEIHEEPRASVMNREPLPLGAVISAEPGIYLPGKFGVRIEDMLWLTEEGSKNLTNAAKELIVL